MADENPHRYQRMQEIHPHWQLTCAGHSGSRNLFKLAAPESWNSPASEHNCWPDLILSWCKPTHRLCAGWGI